MNSEEEEEEDTHLPHHTRHRLTLSQPRIHTPPPPPFLTRFPPKHKLRFINKTLCTVNSAVFIHVTFILRAVRQARRGRLI